MKDKSLIANWIAKCEEDRKTTCKNNICEKCKYSDVCIKLMRIDTVFRIRGYIK